MGTDCLQLLCETPSPETTNRQEAPKKQENWDETKMKEKIEEDTEHEILTKLSALRCGATSALAAGEETRKQP